jgi:hypothetical protein
MAQYARPLSDVQIGSWSFSSGLELSSCIDEETANDFDYAFYQGTATLSYCEVLLSSVTDPSLSTGHHVWYRCNRQPTNRTITCVVRLMQGATQIASWTHTNGPDTTTTFDQTLSESQADSITDYSDLRLRFDITAIQNAQGGYAVTWAALEVPDYETVAYITHQ